MATSDSIFRDYKPAEAERSDRSAGDRLRHRQKVRESIRENIADIIAEESIIGKNKGRVIKVGGKLPVNLSLGAYYNALRPQFGSTWQLRTQIAFIF